MPYGPIDGSGSTAPGPAAPPPARDAPPPAGGAYRTNWAADSVMSSRGCGTTPSSSVAAAPIVTAAAVRAPGSDTAGVVSPGSDSHISTTTRRYGKASTMLVITPAI